MIRNVIFDWSGTLVDDLPAVLLATNHVFRLAGLPEMSLDRFRAEFSLPFRKFYDRFTPHIPLPQLEEWFHGHFRVVQDSVVELPHAREFLAFCRERGLRTFVLSAVHADHFQVQARRTGFDAFLDQAYVGVLDKQERIGAILAENTLAARETVFVGDMQHDIDAARHGGVWACAVLTGYNGVQQLRASGPDLIVEHLGELRALLERSGLELDPAHAPTISPAERRPVATVGALVFDPDGRVLMVRTRKWSHHWGIPGGKIERGETSEAALRRELKEETGLEIDAIEFVQVQDCIDSAEFYRPAHFILLNYTCRCGPQPRVVLNDEADAYQWLPPKAALDLALNQPTRILLETVLARGIPCATANPAGASGPGSESPGAGR